MTRHSLFSLRPVQVLLQASSQPLSHLQPSVLRSQPQSSWVAAASGFSDITEMTGWSTTGTWNLTCTQLLISSFSILIYFTCPGKYLHHTLNSPVFTFPAFLKYNWNVNCVYLKCIIWCFKIHKHYKIFSTRKLINTSFPILFKFFLFVVKQWRCSFLANFRCTYSVINYIHNVLRTHSSHHWKSVRFHQHLPISPTPSPWQPPFYSLFLLYVFRLYMQVISYSICLSLYGLFSLSIMPSSFVDLIYGWVTFHRVDINT